jgi:hypothetical protein
LKTVAIAAAVRVIWKAATARGEETMVQNRAGPISAPLRMRARIGISTMSVR